MHSFIKRRKNNSSYVNISTLSTRFAQLKAPEVLAPAGSPDCLPAAVAGGADAVYLGLRHFNARGRAENFRLADLPQQVAYLHHHQVKAYVVMNTLLHDDEFPKALAMAVEAQAAGVDAFLVQDLGLWQTLQREIPDIEVHASTQMSVHCASQVDFLAQRGAKRIVVARELSLPELRDITTHAASLGVEIEHFVHGALCYAYSGQCLMSNFSGCRSANRGTCAQNCRFDYTLDKKKEEDKKQQTDTHLSMKDLSLIDRVAEMADAGVASLKIEGRLKGPEYVYTVASAFRAAVDAWRAKKNFNVEAQRERLNMVFSRGHSSAPLDAVYDQQSRLHRYDTNDKKQFGTLVSCQRKQQQLIIRSEQTPQSGQGFSFSLDNFNDGFLITHVRAEGRTNHWQCTVRIQEHGPQVPAGTPIILNADQQLKQDVLSKMAALPMHDIAAPRIPVTFLLDGAVGQRLSLSVDYAGQHISVCSEIDLESAQSSGLDAERVQQSLGALGGTAYSCVTIDGPWDILTTVFIPARYLKKMRREIVAQLDAIQENAPEYAFVLPSLKKIEKIQTRSTRIIAAVHDMESAQAALAAGASEVWLESWNDQDLAQLPAEVALRLSPLHTEFIEFPPARKLVAGHWGQIQQYAAAGHSVSSDHYCNAMNSLSLQALADAGVSASVLSLECSAREVARLAQRCQDGQNGDTPQLLLCVHGRLPSMLSRQDHGIAIGSSSIMQAAQHDGALPYEIEARAERETWIWEARRLCAPTETQSSAGIVDGWLLELGAEQPQHVAELCRLYAALAQGENCADEITALSQRESKHGLFSGHIAIGSRALDDLQV